MCFDLCLHSRTAASQPCWADVSVYADSQKTFQRQTNQAAESVVWLGKDLPHDPIPEGAEITIEHVERI